MKELVLLEIDKIEEQVFWLYTDSGILAIEVVEWEAQDFVPLDQLEHVKFKSLGLLNITRHHVKNIQYLFLILFNLVAEISVGLLYVIET